MRRGFLAALIAIAAATPALAADLLSAKLVENGTLTFGVAATFTPFEYTREGKPVGFDIDLIEALTKKLGVSATPMNMDFNGLIPALKAGRIDVINSGMYINPTRSAQVDFVPYLKIGNEVLVSAGNPAKITGRDNSLCGKTVAVTLGAIEETFARQDDKRCKDAGLAAVTILTFPTGQDSYLAVRQGRADAAFDSSPGVVELMDNSPGVYAAVGPEFEANTQIGIATRKGDTAMSGALTAALKEIVADGTYKSLIAKWKLPPTASLFN
jgi:polar amino acid transport system substrate-binding protein